MKYIDEYRENKQVQMLAQAIHKKVTRPWSVMEVCGGQTCAIARYRLEELLPPVVRLLHGPGCPVCVTPVRIIDQAIALSLYHNVILATFGDMMRVPGGSTDLLHAKARGADIRVLYSPLDALALAAENKDKEVVFFAAGFETTLPVHLTALREALRRGLQNFSLLTSFFTVPPVMEALLSDPSSRIQAFLTAGHVCAVTGNAAYHQLAQRYHIPMAVTGFEPADLLYGIYCCVDMLERQTYSLVNAYKRAVAEEGNLKARLLMEEMLEPCLREWRGIGEIPGSGLRLRKAYAACDAEVKFGLAAAGETISRPQACIAGEIMRGHKQPSQCSCFGTACTPDHPAGAPMVSQEGVCAAYYRYNMQY